MPPAILVRLEGGLGNQMFQYAAARALAMATGRHLLLDPTAIGRGPSGRRYELSSFLIDGKRAGPLDRLMARGQVGGRLPAAAHAIARAFSTRRWQLLRDQGAGFDERLFTTTGDLVLEGPWQSAAYVERDPRVAMQLRREFGLREPMPSREVAIQAEIVRCEAVGVHVRRGDYVTNPAASAFHGVLPLDYYSAAAEMIAAEVGSSTFFVFSDDLPWATAHLRLPGPTHFVAAAAGQSPAVEQRLMASCRHFVIANSTFSWWAAWLGEAAGKIVVAPKRWFTAAPAPSGLIPAGWRRL